MGAAFGAMATRGNVASNVREKWVVINTKSGHEYILKLISMGSRFTRTGPQAVAIEILNALELAGSRSISV